VHYKVVGQMEIAHFIIEIYQFITHTNILPKFGKISKKTFATAGVNKYTIKMDA